MRNSYFQWPATLLLFSLFCCASPAQSNLLEDMKWEPAVVTNPPNAVKLWFPVGEKLTYSVHWGIFEVATSVITTDWVTWLDGRLLLRIRYRTKSLHILDKLYPVNDLIESYIDPVTFLPVRFIKNMNEGSRREKAMIDFNHAAKTAHWRRLVKNYQDYELPIASDTRDIPSLSYWLRKDGFLAGTTNEYELLADDKIYKLILRVLPEKKGVAAAEYDSIPAVRVIPEAQFEGLFVRKGKIDLKLSKGAPCMLLSMDAEVPVAKIRLRLTKIEGPQASMWATIWPDATKDQ
ncbi:MAG: DUF3108 domain-containing protein [Kiritimatiellia bacterium]